MNEGRTEQVKQNILDSPLLNSRRERSIKEWIEIYIFFTDSNIMKCNHMTCYIFSHKKMCNVHTLVNCRHYMTAQLALIESDRVSLSLSRLSNIILRDHKLAEEGVEKVD